MKPYEIDVSSRYGAPMGRKDERPLTGKVRLQRVSLDSGGYDRGGAYWGHGSSPEHTLFCAWGADGGVLYLREASREAAKAKLLREDPTLRFFI